jgi:hypothetical protein
LPTAIEPETCGGLIRLAPVNLIALSQSREPN